MSKALSGADLRGGAVGVDVGGTFTDLVAYIDGTFVFEKVLTTPDDMRLGVVAALESIGSIGQDVAAVAHLFHGTTAVINALVQESGAAVGLIATRGFRDVCEIGRGSRLEPYDMLFAASAALVPSDRRVEVAERIAGDGTIIQPLDELSVSQAVETLLERGAASIAVSLLNSYTNPTHEERVREIVLEMVPGIPVSLGSSLVREWKEFERTQTAIMDAFVKPMMQSYLRNLGDALGEARFTGELRILQSNGGVITPRVAEDRPLSLVESGPSAGIQAAAEIARERDLDTVLAFDVGGTTAKASLIRHGLPRTVRPYYVAGDESRPSLLPVVDVIEVGAGGGSIAYVDEGGALKVGPRSAGAEPGPVSYGRGGTDPTVTDAHVVLGRIDPRRFLGGSLPLDAEAARDAIATRIADPLGLTVEEAAAGILRIVNTRMAVLLRQASVVRGVDPRALTLVASGGAGPLHATEIAAELSIREVIIPPHPAHFSALGMLLSDVRYSHSRTVAQRIDALTPAAVAEVCAQLRTEIGALYSVADDAKFDYSYVAELCYDAQSSVLEVPLSLDAAEAGDLSDCSRAFEVAHEQRFGYVVPDEPVRLATVVVHAVQPLPKPSFAALGQSLGDRPQHAASQRLAYIGGKTSTVTAIDRSSLTLGTKLNGPLLVEEDSSTTVICASDLLRVEEPNLLRIEVGVVH